MTSLAPRSERLPAVAHLSRKGLRLDKGTTYEEWKQAGSALGEMHDLTAWALGDWRRHGIWSKFYAEHPEAAQLTLLPEATLKTYEQASGAFQHERRRGGLNIHHHAEVSRLEESAQDQQLDLAEAENLWPADLRARLKGEIESHDYVKVTVRVNRESYSKFEQAATRLGMNVADWLFMCGAAESDAVVEP